MIYNKGRYGIIFLIMFMGLTQGLLFASYGQAELQTVKASGVTVIKTYKVPDGEETGENFTKSESDEQDNISPQNALPPEPQCQIPTPFGT